MLLITGLGRRREAALPAELASQAFLPGVPDFLALPGVFSAEDSLAFHVSRRAIMDSVVSAVDLICRMDASIADSRTSCCASRSDVARERVCS